MNVMNEFKKCKVVMLSSSEKSYIGYGKFQLCEDKDGLYLPMSDSDKREALKDNNITYKHLYILSDDEIKEGDYVYDGQYGSPNLEFKIYKWSYEGWIESPDFEDMKVQKIIASTDTSLNVLSLDETFIKQYIKANGFDEVLIEYENKKEELEEIVENLLECCNEDFEGHIEESPYYHIYCESLKEFNNYKPKLIKISLITEIKSSFNKEELPIQSIKDCLKYCENQQIYDKLSQYGDFYYKLNQFIKENDL